MEKLPHNRGIERRSVRSFIEEDIEDTKEAIKIRKRIAELGISNYIYIRQTTLCEDWYTGDIYFKFKNRGEYIVFYYELS